MLKDKITDSGMTVKAVAEKSGILRETLYNRLKGVGEFTASGNSIVVKCFEFISNRTR